MRKHRLLFDFPTHPVGADAFIGPAGDHWSPGLRPHSFLSLFEKEKNRRAR